MSLTGRYLLPHPPIVIPEVGRGEEKKIPKTTKGFEIVGREIAQKAPETIIIITPHGAMFEDAVSIYFEDRISGDLSGFGVPSVCMDIPINKSLANKIFELANEENIYSVLSTKSFLKNFNASPNLDHGAMVPLYFINKFYKEYNLVHITYAALTDDELYRFGTVINAAVEELNIDAVFIASGDLSHRLKEEGPYGYNPSGEKFDNEFLDCLKKGDAKGVLKIDNKTIQNAGECGRRSVVILLGTLDGKKFSGDLLSYEGTFGVGYGVMIFNTVDDPFVKLARESLTTYLETGEMLKKIPEYVTKEMKDVQRGVFVSLKKHGDLRGCIGTIFPTTKSICEEIIRNAVEAGIYDPRINEVIKEELGEINFSVDVLTEPESCEKKDLDPKEYGVIVGSRGRKGLLLPDLEGVDTVFEQLSIALRKAGINPNENYTTQRFKVIRHKE